SNASRPNRFLQFFDRSSPRIARYTVGNRQAERARPIANPLVIARKFMQRVMSHARIERAISGEDVPPEYMVIESAGRDKNGGRERASIQFVHAFANRTAVSVIDSNRNPRTAIPFLVENIQCRDIGKLREHVELRAKVALCDEQAALTSFVGAVRDHPVIGQNQSLPIQSASSEAVDRS